MYICHKLFNLIRRAFIRILMAVFVTILIPQTNSASKETPVATKATLLVLDNCDSDNDHKTPPFGDAVFLLNSRGELVREIHKLTIDWNFVGSGSRAISASEDGRLFAVCENVANKLTVYETATCRELWSLSGEIESAVFANGLVYALNRENIFAIDNTGTIVKHSRIGGLDIAVDPSHDCLWIVGLDVKKCNLDLQMIMTVDPIKEAGGAFSVDVNPDGSIWIAERHIPQVNGSQNRLLKISPDGSILKTIGLNLSPRRVRVDGSDGSVWTTGTSRDFSKVGDDWPETLAELNELIESETHTHKYDSEGKLLLNIAQGGYSIDLDPSDGSVWIAGRKKIWHYSSTGTNLATYEDVSDSQKWLAVVPEESEGNHRYELKPRKIEARNPTSLKTSGAKYRTLQAID